MRFGNIITKNNVFLAPMAGITDLPFRLICKEFNCGMVYTEMVSAKGLLYESDKTNLLLAVDEKEHPVGAQLFGSDPKIVSEMARQVAESDIDFIDINMGCPAPKITRNGEGSALLKNPQLIGDIVYESAKVLDKPLSVKIRKGFYEDEDCAVEVAKIIEQAGADLITLHGRTRDQYYSGKADWESIKRVKQAVNIPVIGNGDIHSPEDAKKMLEYTQCDGVMIGRAAQGNPWIFDQTVHYLETGKLLPLPSYEERKRVILKHVEMLVAFKGEYIGVREMRSHLTSYIKGVHGATEFRKQLMKVENICQIEVLLEKVFA